MNKLKYDYTILTPFKLCVLENFPFIEADFDALTNYQIMCKMVEYMNSISKNQNLVQTNMIELNNWFNNLDVQEEINNKLDSMAESGELQEIIESYLNSNCIVAFNTLIDLKNGENLIEGSFACSYGKNSLNDGYGAFYKIRTINSSDVVDNDKIVALNTSNTLIAEKITFADENKRKYVFIGDSYGDGFSPDGNVTSWITLLANKLGLSSNDYKSLHLGGTGFSTNRPDYNFINLLNNQSADEYVTDVYVCGGYNDFGQTSSSIIDGIVNFNNRVKQLYPNATLHIGFIGWSSNSNKILQLRSALISYKKACDNNNLHFLKGCEFALHNYFKYFSSDGIHPNQTGQNSIATALYNCIKYGDANVIESETMYFSVNDGTSFSTALEMILQNGIVSLQDNASTTNGLSFNTPKEITGNYLVEVATLSNSLIIGNDKNGVAIHFSAVVNNGSNQYSNQNLILVIKDGKLYLGSPHASGGSYTSILVGSLQIISFSGSFSALMC